MRDKGFGFIQIAYFFNTTRQSIYRALRRRQAGDINYRRSAGRKQKTTESQDRHLKKMLLESISPTRRLDEDGLQSRRRAACPLLKRKHRAIGLRSAREQEDWGIAESSREEGTKYSWNSTWNQG
ncbi:uncharacterized protein LOC125502613 [Dendroctonus ponderosae]|uniref:uncharacterized protein LOC125502613 n=1 Tax=Dendroctonus ponderosae TaxID=77166 RepID=UPI002034F38D|nr:uncharacterized protein LOC125502613 [Dendroctonus ponderosae]